MAAANRTNNVILTRGKDKVVFPLPVYHTIGGYKWNNLK